MAHKKSLFVSPVAGDAKDNIRRIVERFGHTTFDFLLLVYDGSPYDDAWCADCEIVHDDAPLFWQIKTHVTPGLCREYEYVFVWMDDLDVLDFDPQNFLQILRAYRIEVAHPSLTADSFISHPVMAHQEGTVGRYTDFVEQMAFVFRGDRWPRFWRLIAPDRNPWGWGYDEVAYAYCRYRRMAVIDAEVIKHLRRGSYEEAAMVDRQQLRRQLRRFPFSKRQTLCPIPPEAGVISLDASAKLWLHYARVRLYVLLGVGYVRALLGAVNRWRR